MILIGRYGDLYGRAGDRCCIQESWHVCYHGLAKNLLIIMECRITLRIIYFFDCIFPRLRKKWLNSSRIQNKQEWSTRQWQESKEVLCMYLPIITLLSEKRLQWYSPLFNLLSGFSSHNIKNQIQNPSWSQFFPILLVCFSLGGKFIWNGSWTEPNCGQRCESEHDPH